MAPHRVPFFICEQRKNDLYCTIIQYGMTATSWGHSHCCCGGLALARLGAKIAMEVVTFAMRIVEATMMTLRGSISVAIFALWCCVSAEAAGSSSKLQVHVSLEFLLFQFAESARPGREVQLQFCFKSLSYRSILDH